MKTKMRIVALVLVLSVALTGAGYAAWGNKITSNTTLNTGEWKIVLENDVEGHSLVAGDEVHFFKNNSALDPSTTAAPLIDNGLPADPNARIDALYDEIDPTSISGAKDVNSTNYVYTIKPVFSNENTAVSFDFYNLHPGTSAVTNYEIRNMGSIPAKIRAINVRFYNEGVEVDPAAIDATTDFGKLFNAIKVSGTLYKHWFSNPASTDAETSGITPITFDPVGLAGLQARLEQILVDDNFILLPKTSANLGYLDSDELEVHNFKFNIPIDSLDGDDGEASSLKVEVEYDFVQYNVMVEEKQ